MEKKENNEVLFQFLERTKDGEFAEVPASNLEYGRVSEEAETIFEEDEYIYSYYK
jgi:hypothetical protein